MINLEKHTINLGTGDVGVSIVQAGSVEKPVPVFAFYNRDNEKERILMGFPAETASIPSSLHSST